MGYIKLTMSGQHEIEAKLNAMQAIPEAAKAGLEAGAGIMEEFLRGVSPIGPGGGAHIRDRVESKVRSTGADVGWWPDDPAVPYYVEYGHGGPHAAPAHPFIQSGVDMAEGQVLDAIVDAVSEYLDW